MNQFLVLLTTARADANNTACPVGNVDAAISRCASACLDLSRQAVTNPDVVSLIFWGGRIGEFQIMSGAIDVSRDCSAQTGDSIIQPASRRRNNSPGLNYRGGLFDGSPSWARDLREAVEGLSKLMTDLAMWVTNPISPTIS